jgi:transcriptional regulator with XRE-family HTH domain
MLRHRARQSRDHLAAATGSSAGAISNYENDVSVPPAPTLRRITQALATTLGIEPRELWEQFGRIMDAASRSEDSDR